MSTTPFSTQFDPERLRQLVIASGDVLPIQDIQARIGQLEQIPPPAGDQPGDS